jgi:hypothetical protein
MYQKDGAQMKKKKLQDTKEYDLEWIIETVKEIFNKDISNFSEIQRKMLRDQYLDNLRDGLTTKEAMEKALQIVLCFNQ